MMYFSSWLVAFASLCAATSIDVRSTACNNSPNLCSKPYNSVVHLGAHDSPFLRDASTSDSTSGNQYYNTTIQLEAGVRLLTAQVHKSNGQWHLCHTSCDLLDAGTLSQWLVEIRKWMDNNPNEVVTVLLVNSDDATRSDLHAEFTTSNITSYVYTPAQASAPESWPTLQTLITANTRLLTFVASLNASDTPAGTSYLMDEFTYIFENPFDNTAFTDFSCDPNRPTSLTTDTAISSNRMPLMNHFLDTTSGILGIETPAIDNITTTNSPSITTVGALGESANNCTTVYGKPPTFLLVDFFDQGPALDTVDRLNAVTAAVGRISPPARDSESGSSHADVTWAGVEALVEQVQTGEAPSVGAWIWGSGKWTWGGINLNGGNILS